MRFSHPDQYLKWRIVPNPVMGFQCSICGFCYSTDNELHNHQRKDGACKRNIDQLTVRYLSQSEFFTFLFSMDWNRRLQKTIPPLPPRNKPPNHWDPRHQFKSKSPCPPHSTILMAQPPLQISLPSNLSPPKRPPKNC